LHRGRLAFAADLGTDARKVGKHALFQALTLIVRLS
jgi:hypothetical protein